jgi:hypothetical protein
MSPNPAGNEARLFPEALGNIKMFKELDLLLRE